MKKVFLSMIALLILPIMVSAEESNGASQTTNDDTAVVRLYENDENGKEIKVSGPTKNGDTYIYSATIVSESNRLYYLDLKPNYEYNNIEYTAPKISYGGLGWHPFALSSSITPYFTTTVDQSSLDLTGEILATVTKKDGSVVKYLLSIAANKKTVYVGDNDEINQVSNITNTTTVDTTSEQQAPKEETIKNPNTGIVIGSGALLIGFVSVLTLQKKNKFNKI